MTQEKGRQEETAVKQSKVEEEENNRSVTHLLQLLSGGGDRYTAPYGELSMWELVKEIIGINTEVSCDNTCILFI